MTDGGRETADYRTKCDTFHLVYMAARDTGGMAGRYQCVSPHKPTGKDRLNRLHKLRTKVLGDLRSGGGTSFQGARACGDREFHVIKAKEGHRMEHKTKRIS